jgi:hypothetical protein
MAENIAKYSPVKCLGWSASFIGASAYILWQPFASGRFVLEGRWGALWPFAAAATLYIVPLSLCLLFRALLFGGKAITINNDEIHIYYPWLRKIVNISEIKSICSNEYRWDI